MQTLHGKAPCPCLHSQYLLVPTSTLVLWGTFPLTAPDTLIPEDGLLLAPKYQSHRKKLPSPLALGSEGTSKHNQRDRGCQASGGLGFRATDRPFRLLLSGQDPATLMSSAGLFGCGQGPERPPPIPGPRICSVQCRPSEGWQAVWVPEVRGGRAGGQSGGGSGSGTLPVRESGLEGGETSALQPAWY